MSDSNDNDTGRPAGRAPLTLKPRPGGAVSAGTVKQSFSHGRSKTVVVETKRRRVDGPGAPQGGLGGPSAAEKRAALDVRPREQAPQRPAPAGPAPGPGPALNLSADELRARQRVLEAARADQEARAAERAREVARR